MIIACLDDLGQDKFLEACPKYATNFDSELPLDEYIKKLKESDSKYNYVFVPSDKIKTLEENDIRHFVAYRKERGLLDVKNHIRLDDDEKIYEKLGNFKESVEELR